MKNLPGIKFVSFLALLGLVGVGVYAWAQGKTDVRSDHPMFIIKFGWEGKTPDDLDLITYTRKEIKDHIEDLRVQNRWHFKVLAGGRRSGKHKNAGADDRANSKRCQRPRPERLLEPMLGTIGVRDQLVDGFTAEQLAAARLRGRSGSLMRSGRLCQWVQCSAGRWAGEGARPTRLIS